MRGARGSNRKLLYPSSFRCGTETIQVTIFKRQGKGRRKEFPSFGENAATNEPVRAATASRWRVNGRGQSPQRARWGCPGRGRDSSSWPCRSDSHGGGGAKASTTRLDEDWELQQVSGFLPNSHGRTWGGPERVSTPGARRWETRGRGGGAHGQRAPGAGRLQLHQNPQALHTTRDTACKACQRRRP